MIKLFGGGKPDHPMADPKEAKRILDALPAQDPFKALEELAHWLESVSSVEGFRLEQRVALLFQLDEAAQPRLRRLAKDYFAAARPSKFQANRLWTQAHEYWRQAGRAYARCVDPFAQGAKGADAAKAQLPLLLVRALRGLAQQIKWMQLCYGPIDAAVWGILNAVYSFAEARALGDAKVAVYPGVPGESTPRLEFIKAVIFSASSPDSLLPGEVELAERLIADCAPKFALAAAPGPELVVWTDLAKAMAPLRIAQPPQAAPGLRCFGGGAALEQLLALAQKIEATRRVPAELEFGAGHEPEDVLEVLRHLATNWAQIPPERRHARHRVATKLSVSHGFDGVLEVLGGAADSLDFDAGKGAESWLVENVSAGGFGAMVPKMNGDWLKVGTLLALQPEGGANWVVGMVRRLNKTSGSQARVGIQTLAKSPAAATFAVAGTAAQGVLLDGETAAEARIALRPGIYVQGQNLESERAGRQHVYLPQGIAERGEDYEIARYREMVRES